MFFAYIFIVIGLLIFLNTLGILTGSFWGFFWAAVFLAIGFKMLAKKGQCAWCGWGNWQSRMHDKIHQKMGDDCCGHCCEDEHGKGHDHDADGQDHH